MDSYFATIEKKMIGKLCRAKVVRLQNSTNNVMTDIPASADSELLDEQYKTPSEVASATVYEISMGRPVSSIIQQNSFSFLLVMQGILHCSIDFEEEALMASTREWLGAIDRWIVRLLEMPVTEFCTICRGRNSIPSFLFYIRARSAHFNDMSMRTALIEFITACMKLSKMGRLSEPDTEDISFFVALSSTYISACPKEQREAATKAVATAIVHSALNAECLHILENFEKFDFKHEMITILDSVDQFPRLLSDFMPRLVSHLKTQNVPEDTLAQLCERYYYDASGSLGRRLDLLRFSSACISELPAAIATRLKRETMQWTALTGRLSNLVARPASRAPIVQNGQATE
ncbi:hypothetical protein PAPHI01_1934 [Pancytospora philotis]|nr:hypothetical protein PAPHI01_1934 [Pancytospora philotis]